ncbi:hypothetical protein MIND_00876700 [Mycena indigotica]|uniref:Uncharacterized protein n=1 Tax=Mycena indigotica TaxID=2126181 RepID=A0A8H6SGS4_9AGAR|nr:uncharacterized protein MIND_00876700 [Mycena indigotica]KAF7299278.1 hypothetical protein MIND_00876700 [Mycena indigotica]
MATLKSYPITSMKDAVPVLSTLLSMACVKAGRHVNEELLSDSVCERVLVTHTQLYQLLKADSCIYSQVMDSVSFPPLVSVPVLEDLHELRDYIEWASSSDEIFKPWMPKSWDFSPTYSDADVTRHFESLDLRKTPNTDNLCIILYNLGKFKQHTALHERLGRLFSPCDKFFVNSSGTGKTRLCFEGLCSNWGFYFTFAVGRTRLGSHDWQLAIQKHCAFGKGFNNTQLDDRQRQEQNSTLALRCFGPILLARLLVFQIFLEMASAGTLTEEHKARWLQIQLAPHAFTYGGMDTFGSLSDLLVTNDAPYLQSNIDDALRKIRKVIGPDEPLFIVLDEAQIASSTLRDSFGDGKPLLWEIIRGWKVLTRDTCKFICVGTDFPPPILLESFELTSETGCFDDPDTHETYITQFLPPKFRDSASGRFLVARLWRWCRGRYRLTDEFLSMLLSEGLQYPHSCLSHFIHNSTRLAPLDALKRHFEEDLPRNFVWVSSIIKVTDFSKLSPDHKDLLLNILYRYMSTHEGLRLNTGEYTELVTKERHARFTDNECLQVALDEPLFLVRAARQLFPFPIKAYSRDRPHHFPSTFITSLRLNLPPTRQSLAYCLAFYITQVFGEARPLLDIVDFPHVVPPWARQTARLVRLYLDEQGELQHQLVLPDAYESLTPLATATATLNETTKWINHEYGTTFCIPSSPNIDLLYALQLSDKSFIWIAVRLFATDEPVMPDTLRHAISLLDIDSIFAETPADMVTSRRASDGLGSLPGVRQRPCVLRTISGFPIEVDLQASVDKRSRDAVALSLTKLRLRETQVMQEDFFAAMVNGVIAGTKRKSRWDDGSMHVERKRAKKLIRETKPPRQDDDGISDHSETMVSDPGYGWDVRPEEFWEEEVRLESAIGAVEAPPSPRKTRKQKPQPFKPKPEVKKGNRWGKPPGTRKKPRQ